MPSVSIAFENTLKMLRPHGVFVFSVPYATQGATVEHFPDLHEFRIEEHDGARRLVNVTRSGETQVFDNLIFHGGEGDTLEMRLFSLEDMLRDLAAAGFQDVQVLSEPCFEFGIYHDIPMSLPIIARREPKVADVGYFGPHAVPSRGAGPAAAPQWLWMHMHLNALAGPLEVLVGNTPCTHVHSAPDLITAQVPDGVLSRPGTYQITLKATNTPRPIRVGAICVYG